jgi:putative heme-binding domain-containing protein
VPLPPAGGSLELTLPTGGEKPCALSAGFRFETDTRERPLFLYQQSLPWTPPTPAPVAVKIVEDPQLAGGDPQKGRAIFFGEAKCNACHTIHGEGASVGPDLSNQFSRQREAILRDIVEPSATINPDYLAYLVQLKDGRRLEGTLQTFGTEKIKVMDATGKGEELNMSDVKSLKQSKLSFMPEGFKDLGMEKLRDLLAFLTSKP